MKEINFIINNEIKSKSINDKAKDKGRKKY